jgi:kumamolisin
MNPVQSALKTALLVGFAIGSLPASAQTINVVIQLKERVPLQEFADNVTDATSPRYGKFYSPDELRALVAPQQADYDATLAALGQSGIEVTRESPTHLWIAASADHTVLENVFQTQFKFTRGGSFTVSQAPTIPQALSSVEAVAGFDNTLKRKPRHVAGLPTPESSPQPGLLPAQIKTAYSFDALYKAGLTGAGQHIAIATYDGFYLSDITNYYKLINLTTAPAVDQVVFNGKPPIVDGSAAETQLDAELSGMIAPGAQIHIFASAENSDAGEEAMFTAILDDNRAHVVNYSWGACETQVSREHRDAMDKVFARAVAQGVNILVASGDSGADSCQNGSMIADWPAVHPDVVAVGGTSIKLTPDNHLKTETGWKLSGGGVSDYYKLPAWQSGVLSSAYINRSIPDVAFNSDNKSGEAIWTHYGSITAHWLTVGGTSMAAPQWAGLLTLINEARATAGKAESGFINPLLYGATQAEQAAMLHDILSGNNGYKAGKGWDAVTGWGTPAADGVLAFLLAK